MSLSHRVAMYVLRLPGHQGGDPFDLTVWQWIALATLVLVMLGSVLWAVRRRH
jgi:hypothetical protein